MQRRPRPTRPSLLALSMGLLSVAPLPLRAQARSIAGLWRYNATTSERVDEPRPRGEMGQEFPGGPGGPRGGGMGGGPRGRGRPSSPESSEQVMTFLRPVLQLLIRQDEHSVSMSDATGQMQTVRTDGQKVKEYSLSGEEIETSARWKDGKLIIERKFGSAGNVRESYSIDPLTHLLLAEVRVSGGGLAKAIEMRRVYDPANGS